MMDSLELGIRVRRMVKVIFSVSFE